MLDLYRTNKELQKIKCLNNLIYKKNDDIIIRNTTDTFKTKFLFSKFTNFI